jgi:hypothetical protein
VTPALGTPSALVLTNATGLVAGGFASSLFAPRVTSVTLTNAQVIALPTTPVTLVAAPGANLRIKLVAPVTLIGNFGAGAYTNVNATYATLQVQLASGDWLACVLANDNTLTVPLARLSDFLGANNVCADLPVPYVDAIDNGNAAGSGEWVQPDSSTALTDAGNALIQLAMDNNGSGVLTGGNAANTLIVRVYYVIESLV